jgi:hypothetical protein
MATRPDSGGQAAPRQANGLAVATLVCGILALILIFFAPMLIVTVVSLVAVVLGVMSLRRGREQRTGAGRAMTIAGLVAAGFCLVLALLLLGSVLG